MGECETGLSDRMYVLDAIRHNIMKIKDGEENSFEGRKKTKREWKFSNNFLTVVY